MNCAAFGRGQPSRPGPTYPQEDFFDRHAREMPPHRALLRAVECRLMSQVPLRHPVLDIGTGDGHFASVAFGEAIDVGIDILWRDLLEATARAGVYRWTLQASATELPFRNHTFNTVVSNCAIEHVPDLQGALREIVRVLRAGGTFAITVPSERFAEYLLGTTLFRTLALRGLAGAYGAFFNRISHLYHAYPPDVWTGTLSAAGLRVVEHQYYFSATAHRAFDLCHYLGVPYLVSRRLTGKWVLHPVQSWPFRKWLRRYYEEPWPNKGAYQFIRCEKPT